MGSHPSKERQSHNNRTLMIFKALSIAQYILHLVLLMPGWRKSKHRTAWQLLIKALCMLCPACTQHDWCIPSTCPSYYTRAPEGQRTHRKDTSNTQGSSEGVPGGCNDWVVILCAECFA